jgi:hypothetical protein
MQERFDELITKGVSKPPKELVVMDEKWCKRSSDPSCYTWLKGGKGKPMAGNI